MAFANNNLSVLAYANGFTLWHYKTGEAAEIVGTSGYFNNATNMLRVGDMIIAQVHEGTTFFVVTDNNGTEVLVSKPN